jgi:cytochrome c553
MRALKLIVPSAVLTAGFLICTTASYGTPEYAKKEKKGCTFCHGKMETGTKDGKNEAMVKNLTDAGKYYKEHSHSLDGYTPKK